MHPRFDPPLVPAHFVPEEFKTKVRKLLKEAATLVEPLPKPEFTTNARPKRKRVVRRPSRFYARWTPELICAAIAGFYLTMGKFPAPSDLRFGEFSLPSYGTVFYQIGNQGTVKKAVLKWLVETGWTA